MDDLFYTEIYAPDTLEVVRNDTLATAQTLTEGTYEIDGLGQDWFRIDPQAGFMSFVMTPGAEPLNLDMSLHDSDGNRIQRDVAASGAEDFSRRLSTADTYYLRVYAAPLGDNPPSDTPLDYTLSIDLPEIVEDNNAFRTTATPLAEGTHSVLGTGVDWWQVSSPSGLINLTLDTVENLADSADFRDDIRNLNMEIYNSDGGLVRSNFSAGTQETISYLAPEAGEYFIKVYAAQFGGDAAPDNVVLSYNLTVDLPEDLPEVADTNGSLETADALTGARTVVTDGVGSDWYRITTGPGTMDFAMTHTGATTPEGQEMNLNMRLYDSAGNPVRSDFQEFSNESFEVEAGVTGTYYLNVYWAPYEGRDLPAGVVLDYVLDVDLPRNTWSKELEFGPIRNASVTVYDIDGDGKDEIFAGAVKGLDDQANEVLPGGLIVLEDNGDVKWTQTFAAFAGPDPVTGKTYNTTSVTTAPTFSDLDSDGSIDIVVGVGADNRGEFSPAGQPGDLGGVYALNADGSIKWFHESIDSFGTTGSAGGEAASGPDGRPDGVYGTPRVFDIDADGQREVIFTSWDHYLYVLDGRDGSLEFTVDLHDTAGATPGLADLDNDGLFELIVPADISQNTRAGLPTQGGILHVMNNYGHQTVDGWDTQVGTSTGADFRGKFEPQSLWSSPKVVDLDNNGTLEIVQGTGNFFQDERGEYIKVWNADGSLRHQLDTEGRVLASPLIADLTGDGSMEIIAATLDGYVYAWNAAGQQVFATQAMPFDNNTMTGTADVPIARQPIAVDLTGDGNLEVLVSIGSQLVVLNASGQQITNTDKVERAFNNYAGSPVAHDVDADGYLDLITGGTNAAQDHAVIYRWENIVDTQVGETRIAEYQNVQSLHDIENFVDQLYDTILGRSADPNGRNNWVDRLYTGVRSGADVASGFIFSPEFTSRGTTNEEYVTVLYEAFFGRAPDDRGFARWTGDLEGGLSRAEVLSGFTGSPQFTNLANSFGIRAESRQGAVDSSAVLTGGLEDSDVLRAGTGNNVLKEGPAAVNAVVANGTEVTGQVYRLYGATLGRAPDSNGFEGWYNGLVPGLGTTDVTLSQAAGAFVNSAEFQKTYGSLTNAEFVTTLYQNVLDRAPDERGLARWTGDLANGVSRADVVIGFSEGQEFRNSTTPELDTWMGSVRPQWNDVLEGGAGNDQMNGGFGSDVFVFRNGQGGADVIHGFEPWDQLQLSGFGFATADDARANMRQSGNAVIFQNSGQTITFNNTSMADMNRVRFNVS